jgi:hypothetical protein
MKVMIIASWDDQTKLPGLAAKVVPIFSNPPEGVKRLCSYGAIGGYAVYSVYEVDNEVALTKYAAALGIVGFTTEVIPVIDTEAGIKALLEQAKALG